MAAQRVLFLATLFTACALPPAAHAHQPRIVEGTATTTIERPEISKAYYGRLSGEAHVFTFTTDRAMQLYFGLSVPALPGTRTDISAALLNPRDTSVPLALLSDPRYEWKPFFEEFARGEYLSGPEARIEVEPGSYEIRVWSSNNDSPYVLAVGEKESFPLSELVNAYRTLPRIQEEFFGKPAYTAYLTPVLGGPILAAFVLALIVMFGARFFRRRLSNTTT